MSRAELLKALKDLLKSKPLFFVGNSRVLCKHCLAKQSSSKVEPLLVSVSDIRNYGIMFRSCHECKWEISQEQVP